MLWWFAETTIVASVLALLAAGAGRWKRLGPSARHALWLVVLLKLITPPLVGWPFPNVSRWGFFQTATIAEPSADRVHKSEATWAENPKRALQPTIAPVSTRGSSAAIDDEIAVSRASASASTVDHASRFRIDPDVITRGLFGLWLTGSVVLGFVQGCRVLRFRRGLRGAVPASLWLVEEAERIGAGLGVRVPEILIVPSLCTPVLWCLGRPKLLLPARLVLSFEATRWRGVLAHELAHLRRGDPWVSRLVLVAGLIWWWNPLYWVARRRLDAEAELACDAWVVSTLPDERFVYAETLLEVCTLLSAVPKATPALGVAGSGRFLERRLTMILRDDVPCRLSFRGLLATAVLALLASPSWTQAGPYGSTDSSAGKRIPMRPAAYAAPEDDDRDTDADADDDETRDKATERARKKIEAAQRKLERDAAALEAAKKQLERSRSTTSEQGKKKLEERQKHLEKQFGPGSEFEKRMEAFGKDMEKQFGPGSEFEKRMEKFGKEMEKKLGPGSEFEKEMKAFGEEVKKQLGPGSEFEKEMKAFGEKLKRQFGEDSEFKKEMKAFGEKAGKTASKPAKEKREGRPGATPRPRPSKVSKPSRDRRIQNLEAQIEKLRKELETLKADQDEDDDEEN